MRLPKVRESLIVTAYIGVKGMPQGSSATPTKRPGRPDVSVKFLPDDGELHALADSIDRVGKQREMRRRQLAWLCKRMELRAMRSQQPFADAGGPSETTTDLDQCVEPCFAQLVRILLNGAKLMRWHPATMLYWTAIGFW
jgi:hypothetical protein